MSGPPTWPPPSSPADEPPTPSRPKLRHDRDTSADAPDPVLATWGARALAMIIDSLLLGALAYLAVDASGGIPASGHLPASVSWVSAGLALAYFTVMNGIGSGQTLGNRALRIAVRDAASGSSIGLARSLVRFGVRAVLYLAFFLPGLVNDLFPLWDRRRQTFADKVAGTNVVRLP